MGQGEDKNMLTINEKLYNKMPDEVKSCFNELPNAERDEVLDLFPVTKSGGGKRRPKDWNTDVYGMNGKADDYEMEANSGSASRFFYCAKSSRSERQYIDENGETKQSHHPTHKPIKLMKYLCRLITPTGGTVLDPFMGSGSTGKACKLEGFDFIGIDLEQEYVDIAKARCTE